MRHKRIQIFISIKQIFPPFHNINISGISVISTQQHAFRAIQSAKQTQVFIPVITFILPRRKALPKSVAPAAILRPLGVQAAAIGTGAHTGIDAAALHPEEARLVAGEPLQRVVLAAAQFREGPRIGRGPKIVAVAVPVLPAARLDACADRIVVPFLRPYAGAPVHAARVPRVAVVRIAEAPAEVEDVVLIAAAYPGIERSRAVLVPAVRERTALKADAPALRTRPPYRKQARVEREQPRGVHVVHRVAAVGVRVRVLARVRNGRACPSWTMITNKVSLPGRRAAGYPPVGAPHWRMRATLRMPHATRDCPSKSRKFIQSIHGNLKIYIVIRTRTEILGSEPPEALAKAREVSLWDGLLKGYLFSY